MKKKKLFLMIFMFLYLYYFFNDASKTGLASLSQIITTFFDSFNGCLYTTTILLVPVLLVSQIEYKTTEIYIRKKGKIFEYVWTKNLQSIISTLIYIFTLFIVLSLLFKINIEFLNVQYIIRISIFIVFCFVVRELVYILTKFKILGTIVLIIHNFVLLGTVYGINFYVYNNAIPMINLLYFLEIYATVISIIGMICLYKYMDKKEIL